VKTTLEIPDPVFRRAKSVAAQRDVQSVFDDRKKKRPTPRATRLSLFVPSAKTQGIGMLDFYPTIMRVGSGIQMGGRYGM
jgi:hypothetical protein